MVGIENQKPYVVVLGDVGFSCRGAIKAEEIDMVGSHSLKESLQLSRSVEVVPFGGEGIEAKRIGCASVRGKIQGFVSVAYITEKVPSIVPVVSIGGVRAAIVPAVKPGLFHCQGCLDKFATGLQHKPATVKPRLCKAAGRVSKGGVFSCGGHCPVGSVGKGKKGGEELCDSCGRSAYFGRWGRGLSRGRGRMHETAKGQATKGQDKKEYTQAEKVEVHTFRYWAEFF